MLGIPIDMVTMQQTVALLADWIEEGRPRHVVTVNPEFIMLARRNAEFRRVLLDADLAVADGIGTVLAARILGRSLPERVGGVDLVERFAVSAPPGTRLFLLGAKPGVAKEVATVLAARNGGLASSAHSRDRRGPSMRTRLWTRIVAARPHVLLVAFGAPMQELWIARNKERLHVPVCVGVGGAFDFISGRAPRAPLVVQRAGLEWLYRLTRQPWRWKRMLALPRFAVLVVLERARTHRSAADADTQGRVEAMNRPATGCHRSRLPHADRRCGTGAGSAAQHLAVGTGVHDSL